MHLVQFLSKNSRVEMIDQRAKLHGLPSLTMNQLFQTVYLSRLNRKPFVQTGMTIAVILLFEWQVVVLAEIV